MSFGPQAGSGKGVGTEDGRGSGSEAQCPAVVP